MISASEFDDRLFEVVDKTCRKVDATFLAYKFVLQANLCALENLNAELTAFLGEVEECVRPLGLNLRTYLTAMLFVDLVAEMEHYLTSVIRLVLLRHPRKIGSAQFKLSEILEVDKNELVLRAADEHLYKLMYKKPGEYLADMCSLLSIDKTTIDPYWASYIEAKARRDVGVHNDWIANDTYRRKCIEGGAQPLADIGHSLLPRDREYINDVSRSALRLVRVLAVEASKVHGAARGA